MELEPELQADVKRDDSWSRKVIGQSVDEGKIVPKGTPITLYLDLMHEDVSNFHDMVIVPKVVGMEQMDATKLINESGLQFQVWWTEENNHVSEQYYIINQSIPAGSEVPAGSLIKLELSLNKPNEPK